MHNPTQYIQLPMLAILGFITSWDKGSFFINLLYWLNCFSI